ncbi:AraC family transcriptional regulator [Paenibacillus sp.]|uniref:AraC family transcriptional regulator n=1 Tax=Paenibacillus sp. TaxID=58172 RepID=UPI002D5D18E8|nr:AraC family transcriptional regulator [Paenibacillus sp.]HZG58571.1 AraC family transcriptional regulator [Paenibacillus sp.]
MHRLTTTSQAAAGPIVPYVRESDRAVRRPWRVPERRLLDYLLVFVRRGRCVFTVDGCRHEFRDGEFALIQPGSLCELEGLTDTETPFAHFDVFFSSDRERSFPTRPGQTDLTAYLDLLQPRMDDVFGFAVPVRLRPRDPKRMRDALLRLVDTWLGGDSFAPLSVQAAATELIAMVLADHAPPDRDGTSKREPLDELRWIPSYFSLHLHEPLPVETMAARAGLSPSRFAARFKATYGMPPHRYLLEMRVAHAGELLRSTSLSQEEIAAYCGFADVHHFSKAFKRITGAAPGAWRSSPL